MRIKLLHSPTLPGRPLAKAVAWTHVRIMVHFGHIPTIHTALTMATLYAYPFQTMIQLSRKEICRKCRETEHAQNLASVLCFVRCSYPFAGVFSFTFFVYSIKHGWYVLLACC